MMFKVVENKTSSNMTSVNPYKDDFPIFLQNMNGKPLTYLDTAASAQKPAPVINAMTDFMQTGYANIHRGLYDLSQGATRKFEDVRTKVQKFVNAQSPENVIFTKNTTEAINLVAQSWGKARLTQGDVILLTEMEHHANIVPWTMLRDQMGVELRILPVDDAGELILDELDTLLTDDVKILSFVAVSNALGTINPVDEICDRVKKFNPEIKILVDASQAVVHNTVDFTGTNCDFLVFTGHKLYGPTGIGVLVGHGEVLDDMPPFLGGGDMIETVTFDDITYKAPPSRFEAGTPPIVEAIGLGAAIDYVSTIGMPAILEQEKELGQRLTEELGKIPGTRLYGTATKKAAIQSFTIDGTHPSDLSMILDQMGVAIRTGHHCCMPLMKRYGIDGTARASIGLYNDHGDVDRFIEAIRKAVKMLT